MKREEQMASFVVNLGISPSEYYALTLGERSALAKAYEAKVKAQNRKR